MILKVADAQLLIKSAIDSSAVKSAVVTIKGKGIRLTSDEKGKIETINKTDSLLFITIFHPSFIETSIYVGRTATIYLAPEAYAFETMVATGELFDKKNVKDVIANAKVINDKDIKITGSQNLGDILKYQSNITLSNDPVLGTAVSINGIGGQNIKLLKNGAAVSGAMNGSIDVSQINVNNIEQIEIIDGPMSLLYGSNALGGTINLINKIPAKKTSVKAKTHTETSGIFNVSCVFNKMIRKNYLSLHIGRNFFDGWNPDDAFFYSPASKIADTNRISLWKPREQIIGDISLVIPLGKLSELKFNADILNEQIINKGLPKSPYYETAFDDYYKTLRNINSLEFNYKGKKLKQNILASFSYFNRKKNTYMNDLTSSGKGIITAPESQDTTKLLTSQLRYITQARVRKVDLNFGIDANHEVFYGKRIINNQKSIRNISFIAVASYNLNNRYDFRLGLRQTLHSLDKIPLIPSFSTKIKVNKSTEIKFSLGKGFRSPGVKELYMYFVDINHNIKGNAELKSESSENMSVGFNKRLLQRKNRTLTWQVNSYYNQFRNLISLAAINNTEYTYINIGKSKNAGLNSELKYSSNRFETSFQNAVIALSNNDELRKSPAYFTTYNFGTRTSYKLLKNKNLGINGFANHFGKSPSMFVVDNQPVVVHSQAYWMIDLTCNYSLKMRKVTMNFNLGLKNLNNIKNISSMVNAGSAHQTSGNQRLISTGRNMFLSIECIL